MKNCPRSVLVQAIVKQCSCLTTRGNAKCTLPHTFISRGEFTEFHNLRGLGSRAEPALNYAVSICHTWKAVKIIKLMFTFTSWKTLS